jgi:hypothetical protein
MTAEMLLWCRDDWWNAADEEEKEFYFKATY